MEKIDRIQDAYKGMNIDMILTVCFLQAARCKSHGKDLYLDNHCNNYRSPEN